MILDDALNLYLLEVNQTPNMYADKTIYEHVVYSTLNLVGVGSPLKKSFQEPLYEV